MASRESFLLLLVLLCTLSHLHGTLAALYKVGNIHGKWGVENYFQVGDSLSFSEHTESTSVQQVSREDYQACEAVSPMRTYRDGDSVADLKEESVYYFISGIKEHCLEGRKLVVVVLASAPAASPSSPPATTPSKTPSATPPSVTPAAAPPPKTPSAPSPAVVATPPLAHAPITTTPPAATPAHEPTTSPPTVPPVSLPSSPASTPTATSSSPTPSLSPTSPTSSPKGSLATPPSPSGPASSPATHSAAPLTDLRGAWMVAAAGLCSGLMLLL